MSIATARFGPRPWILLALAAAVATPGGARAEEARPLKIGVIGAGKIGSAIALFSQSRDEKKPAAPARDGLYRPPKRGGCLTRAGPS